MNTGIVIGSTKSFEPKYGLINLVKAFCIVSNEILDLKLWLVGGGSLKTSIETYIKDHCPDKNIRIEDPVDVMQIPSKLNNFDIFVMPSISESETFGVAALEASACELPVIGSRIGGIPEVIKDGETGILLPPDDVDALVSALLSLIIDRDKRVNMGKSGRIFVKSNYLWDKNVDMLLSHYVDHQANLGKKDKGKLRNLSGVN